MSSFLESLQTAFDWLKGRKTIATILALGGSASLESADIITVPYWIYAALATLAVVFLKMAINRLETAANAKKK